MFEPSRNRGVALISVLLVVAILLAVAANLMTRHSLVISQNQNTYSQNQALQYALGAEALARQVLFEDFSTGGPEIDHFGEVWAQAVLPFELDEGGFLEAQVSDLQGCFNINNVLGSGDAGLKQMRRLLINLGVQPQIADGWKDWVDSDDTITGFGAEDSEYLLAQVPHRTPNTLVTHTSELRQLQNVTAEELALVMPEVCALPQSETRLNVNTAQVQALAALDDTIAPGSLVALTESERAYASVADFLTDYPDFQAVQAQLSVTSEYFALHAIAQVGDTSFTIYSQIHRDPNDGKITVLSRDFGKLFRSNVEVSTTDA